MSDFDQDRRPAKRHRRRLSARFRPAGSTRELTGFTTNISATGMFLATRHTLATGTRVRVELLGEHGFVVEAEVVWVQVQPLAMRGVRPSGMGLRFVPIERLIREAIGAPKVEEPEAPESSTEVPHFRVAFKDTDQFLRVLDRDLQTGGLFLLTDRALEVEDPVTVEIVPPGDAAAVVRCEAKVVFTGDPRGQDGGRNLMAGVGVEITDREAVLARLQPIAARFR